MVTDLRVLIVDDDASVRASLTAFLEDEGFVARSVASGHEALEVLSDEPIDVAIVDLRLGEMDGERFISRAHEIRTDTQFLIYTGTLGYQLADELLRVGMTQSDVLYKPVRSMKVVVEAIRRVAAKEQNDVRQQHQ